MTELTTRFRKSNENRGFLKPCPDTIVDDEEEYEEVDDDDDDDEEEEGV